MTRIGYLLGQALRRPRIAWEGAREFRLSSTPHLLNLDELESYDSGRELAHMLTFRRWDQ